MVLLIAEGSHFTFHVEDVTRNSAMRRLRIAFNQHLRAAKAPHARVEDALTVNVIDPFVRGVVYRDYAPMPGAMEQENAERRALVKAKITKTLGKFPSRWAKP